jgi:subfamily B ATP-binding cassette protein MsbA
MEAGTIVETGAHAELIQRGGAYSRLVRAQLLSDVDEDTAPAGLQLN